MERFLMLRLKWTRQADTVFSSRWEIGRFISSYVALHSYKRKSSNSSRKKNSDIFLFIMTLCYVYSLESPHRGDSNEYTQHTIIV